jgi:hypothetical protein
MKNELTSFEMQYREAALGQLPALDLDFMKDLENRLDEKKRRGGFFFGWFKGMALSIAFLILGMSSILNEPLNWQKTNASTQIETTDLFKQNKIINNSISDVKINSLEQNNQIESPDLSLKFTAPSASLTISNPSSESSSFQAIQDQKNQGALIDTLRLGQLLYPIKELMLGLLAVPQLSHQLLNKPQTQQNSNRNREIALYSGVNFTKSYLYSDFNVVSAYDLKLTQSESVLTTTNFGLQLYNYSGQLQWGIGALFTSLGEQANYNYIDYKLEPSSTSPNLQDTIYFEAKYVNKNEYQFIQIPISIGYRFQRNHFSVIPKYSASVGTRVKEQIGYYPNRNGIGMYAFLSPKFNFQQSLQVELRQSQQNFFVSLTPYLNFNSVKTPPEIFSYRKYINFGCNVGVGFRLK